MKGIGRQSFLVVFDFDHTVVDCNTDEVIPAALGRQEEQRRMVAEKDRMQWTKLIDTLIAPFTKAELTQAAHDTVTIDPAMPEVFRYLMDAQRQYTTPATATADLDGDDLRRTALVDNTPMFMEMHVASDSNLLFIEAALDARLPGVKEHLSQVHSNPYYDLTAPGVHPDSGLDVCYNSEARPADCLNVHDEAERDATYNAGRRRKSRLCWYEPHGHHCQCCLAGGKPNMCKSIIIERLLQTTSLIDPTIIFVGDGGNDACPVMNLLRPRDFVFARRDFPLHHILAGAPPGTASHGTPASEVGGCCRVGLWKDAAELLELFQLAMEHPGARLPTLVRFRDVSADEFRSVTMSKRIPSVLKRTLEDLVNLSVTSTKGRARVMALIHDAEENGPVPPLPGQSVVPAWLRNYAYVSEFDKMTSGAAAAQRVSPALEGADGSLIVPRWGQIPWLHGEVYFYHLLWQYLMMAEERPNKEETEVETEAEAPATFNIITPHALHNPLYAQKCHVASTLGMISPPAIVKQGLRDAAPWLASPSLIAPSVVARRVHPGTDAPAKQVPYEALLHHPCGAVLPSATTFFTPYRDIFSREKIDVLVNFLHTRVVPMLACQPWSADADFGGTLLRWMLWGNGVDLSMFTLDQLVSSHEGGDAGARTGDVAALREAEEAAASAQDTHLIGNEVAAAESHLRNLLDPHYAGNGSLQVDVVMDNVGVECIADLCFGLWYTNQAAMRRPTEAAAGLARVVYHVKPMPYYVSDVTPRDFDVTLAELEAAYTEERFEPDAAKRAALQAVLEPFVKGVRSCFERGVFIVDADTVWTQPSEYRDLPPRVINRYFYAQQITEPSAAAVAATSNVTAALAATGCPTSSAVGLCRMNKSQLQARTGLVIFKGDLNYRRLIGDRYWDRCDFLTSLAKEERPDLRHAPECYTAAEQAIVEELTQDTPASAVMEAPAFAEVVGAFWPTHVVPVCSVRTIKSECCLGVPGERKRALDQQLGLSWRVSGKYGEILFAS